MKKGLIILISSIVIVLGLVFVLFIYPKIVYNKDISVIKNKIMMVNDYFINNTGDVKEIKEELKKESVSETRLELEKETNNYLSSVLDNIIEYNGIDFEKINNIFIDEKFKENIDNNVKFLHEEKDKLTNLETKSKELSEINVNNIKDEENKKLLTDLFKNNFKVGDYNKKISDSIENVDKSIEELEFLKKNNNTWEMKDKKVVFNKRSSYNEYKNISSNSLFELIKDEKGPVITASDISITKGTSINIKDKVKCEDAVDGKVPCTINGSYDVNKVGSYTIKIIATDESKNTSTKSIKLTVKEKVTNTKPYYIEVIRNQNVVIVYGLDSNNQYTKIVKVFICSVGKASTPTPTGTFKTSDKASWGWLVGNLYGQYYTRITGSILFHSVPYTKKAKNTLEWDEYNKLGTAASKGCVRMTVRDVKWIYDNCPRGTTVKIYDGNLPSGVSKPTVQKISADSPNKGWDPTDPDKNNPWKK